MREPCETGYTVISDTCLGRSYRDERIVKWGSRIQPYGGFGHFQISANDCSIAAIDKGSGEARAF